MPAARLLAALLLTLAPPLLAQDIDLSNKIASGKWAMSFQRSAELKPLRLKQQENGISYTCIAGDARDKIVGWVSSKGCTIEKESLVNGNYHLEGQCRLKFWKSQAIPVDVDLRPVASNRFTLSIQTRANKVLGYTEQTTATLQGPCDPPSAGQPEQHQGTKT
jgi:hypothetical protein